MSKGHQFSINILLFSSRAMKNNNRHLIELKTLETKMKKTIVCQY